jgi:hypothetical protein
METKVMRYYTYVRLKSCIPESQDSLQPSIYSYSPPYLSGAITSLKSVKSCTLYIYWHLTNIISSFKS